MKRAFLLQCWPTNWSIAFVVVPIEGGRGSKRRSSFICCGDESVLLFDGREQKDGKVKIWMSTAVVEHLDCGTLLENK